MLIDRMRAAMLGWTSRNQVKTEIEIAVVTAIARQGIGRP